jgi:hypothetical protein
MWGSPGTNLPKLYHGELPSKRIFFEAFHGSLAKPMAIGVFTSYRSNHLETKKKGDRQSPPSSDIR